MTERYPHAIELSLLALLALLWGGSYLFLKIAVVEIPPITLIAARVTGAAFFLLFLMALRKEKLPRDRYTWRLLFLQAVFNSIGAWTVLAWGQQYVNAGLASVLNSTSPIFVVLFTTFMTTEERLSGRKTLGTFIGLLGVVLVVGTDALQGFRDELAGQVACLMGAALYAGAALHGKRFRHISALATAAGTMIWAAVFLIPAAIFIDDPWSLRPSNAAIAATVILSILCTGVALQIYFRLVRTIGSIGVASQSYLRAGIGVLLGFAFLGETISFSTGVGILTTIIGVALVNWPIRKDRAGVVGSGATGTQARQS